MKGDSYPPGYVLVCLVDVQVFAQASLGLQKTSRKCHISPGNWSPKGQEPLISAQEQKIHCLHCSGQLEM